MVLPRPWTLNSGPILDNSSHSWHGQCPGLPVPGHGLDQSVGIAGRGSVQPTHAEEERSQVASIAFFS